MNSRLTFSRFTIEHDLQVKDFFFLPVAGILRSTSPQLLVNLEKITYEKWHTGAGANHKAILI